MPETTYTYDVAVSFAGAQRAYVERVVLACEALDLRVFYDKSETVQLWGKNVITELRRVYGGIAVRYVIPFLSKEYLRGSYPMDELQTATVAAIDRGEVYILPVLMDDVVMPPELLSPATVYLRAKNHTPEELARVIADKVGIAQQEARIPHTAGNAGEGNGQLRLPRLTPAAFNSQQTLDAALTRVGRLFQQAADKLDPFGFTTHVRTTDAEITVHIQERGRPVCELRLRDGTGPWSGRLTVSFGWPRLTGDGINGWVTAEWDPDSQQEKLAYDDFGRASGRRVHAPITADELFNQLWEKIMQHVEQRMR